MGQVEPLVYLFNVKGNQSGICRSAAVPAIKRPSADGPQFGSMPMQANSAENSLRELQRQWKELLKELDGLLSWVDAQASNVGLQGQNKVIELVGAGN